MNGRMDRRTKIKNKVWCRQLWAKSSERESEQEGEEQRGRREVKGGGKGRGVERLGEGTNHL